MPDSKSFSRVARHPRIVELGGVGIRAGLLAMALSLPLAALAEDVSLVIRGLDEGRLLTNVRNTVPTPEMACDAPRARLQSYLRDAERRALSALRALGHFNAQVDTRVDVTGVCPKLVIAIEAGPAVRLDRVDIRIVGPFDDDPSAVRFREGLRLRVGDELDQGVYDSARDDLISRARARGYLDARYVERELWVDPEQNIARVTLVLESGARYHFGEIRADQRILEPRFFNRLMPVAEGDPYSSDRLALISSNLAASGYFADVRVRPDIDARSDEIVPVDVLLTERARTAYEFRVGFGTDTGARVRADVDRRRVNRRGHKWRAGVGLSQRIQSIDTVYSIPQRNPLTDSLDVYARLQREDNNAIVANSGTAGAQYSRQRGDWSQALFTEYVYERTTFGNEPQRSSNFLLAGVRLGHRQLDDPLFPTRGHSFTLKLQGAAESLMSSASLTQANVKGAFAYPLGRSILKARGEFGTTWTSDFTELPKSLRFFAGGDNSVRGYAFESLGPRNAEDKVVGGRHLVVMSVEAMHPIVGNDWFGAAFVDVGNAFDSFRDMALKTGAGVGVRWRSPIGMVRVDVAVPFNGTSRSPRVHLGIGAEF
ncbi:autotransporter assembly complex protein TamA [Azoarcus taiwanensis]|uniref:Translocation and assembly module subunit TamA n=1 Tax=Azoarcus taiwanensis TaxID=666964 RepID=A0A972F848_9RHOO|nr:autotransporter assembly complex family protein [Azoarcus taiwanensis]NMG03724.1 BamA/TamA family outer membrane protein [Azoarcus taiwanensis]